MKNIIQKIPKWVPITIIGATITYLIVNKIRKTVLFNKIMQEGSRKEEYDSSKITISDSQAQTLADALYKAFKPFPLGMGTDEKAIINALTGLNANDILLVEQKFGIQDGMNLRAYIKDEISESSDDYSQIRSIYQKNGLNF
jgi:hypothetical protein